MIHGPVSEDGFAVNILARDGAEHARVVGTVAVIAHDEIAVRRNFYGRIALAVEIVRGNVGLAVGMSVDVDVAGADFDGIAGKAHDALDERFREVARIPEDDHVAAIDGLKAIDKFVDEDALLIGEQRGHASAFDLHRLVEKNEDDEGEAESHGEIARPTAQLAAKSVLGRPRGRRQRTCHGRFRHVPYIYNMAGGAKKEVRINQKRHRSTQIDRDGTKDAGRAKISSNYAPEKGGLNL